MEIDRMEEYDRGTWNPFWKTMLGAMRCFAEYASEFRVPRRPAFVEPLPLHTDEHVSVWRPMDQYQFVLDRELMRREYGLSGNSARFNTYGPNVFRSGFYASRMRHNNFSITNKLRRKIGRSTCASFNTIGNLLVVGRTDMSVSIWDWEANRRLVTYNSMHSGAMQDFRFIESGNSLKIVSCCNDGEIGVTAVDIASGGHDVHILYRADTPIRKMTQCPYNQNLVLCSGDDTNIRLFDLRIPAVAMVRAIHDDQEDRPIYDICHHSTQPQLCISSSDKFIRIFDMRHPDLNVGVMYSRFVSNDLGSITPTCVYNKNRSEVLATFGGTLAFLFDTSRLNVEGEKQIFQGSSDIKPCRSAQFFGDRSQYIVTGGGTGTLCFFDKYSGELLQTVREGRLHRITDVRTHPYLPIIVTSGQNSAVKVWGVGCA